QRRQGGGYASNNDIKFQSHKLSHNLGKSLVLPLHGAPLDDEILSFDITQLAHPLLECGIRAERRLARYCGEEANAPDLAGLLRARRERPRGRGTEERDELAAPHSINSSARSRTASGILSPSALAVVRLMTKSNLVGCSTGMSAGFAPRRILST